MKRLLFTLAALVLCAGMLVYAQPIQANKKYGNQTLNGAWYFVTTEVVNGEDAGFIQHCSTFGTIDFDGQGGAVTDETYRCYDDSPSLVPTNETIDTGNRSTKFTYTVNADGSFTMTVIGPVPTGETTHCQIVNGGKMVLCDATESDDDKRSFLAIATRP